jgi:hypothetical protein
MMKCVAPNQAAIKPCLRFRTIGCNFMVIRSESVRIVIAGARRSHDSKKQEEEIREELGCLRCQVCHVMVVG